MIFILIIFYCLHTVFILYFGKKYLHIFQLEEYSIDLFISWLFSHKFFPYYTKIIVFKKAKKALVFTKRAVRLYTTYLFISGFFLTILNISIFIHIFSMMTYVIINILLIPFFTLLPIILLMIAIILISPYEWNLNNFYFKKAQKKLKSYQDIKTIAITGSYGKTSTKHFLSQILTQKYHVLTTPQSYNTPMGISKIINNQLQEDYDYFIVEMGANRKGDIEKLCQLTPPFIGILTAIGEQHLKTFKTQEAIVRTKCSLLKAINPSGFAVYNADSDPIRKNIAELDREKYGFSLGKAEKNPNDTYSYTRNIKQLADGICFDLCLNIGSQVNIEQIKTKLMGRHNAANILAASIVAIKLGFSSAELKKGIENLQPIEHRLNLLQMENDIRILDDAFNSNPQGALEALYVLKTLPGNKKIIITPGMVELGKNENEHNYWFGQRISEYADLAILVGKNNTESIHKGLLDNNFPENKIIITENLILANREMKKIAANGDIILYENDLPDQY